MSDIDTAVVDSLKVLDLKRPIREADIRGTATICQLLDKSGQWSVLALYGRQRITSRFHPASIYKCTLPNRG